MSEEIVSNVDQDTFLITSEKFEKESFEKAIYDFNNKSNFKSTYFNEAPGLTTFKIEDIDNLAYNAQTNLQNIIRINNIVRFFVNKNDILGKVYEAIETNVNSDWELIYPNYGEDDKDTYETVDKLIKNFNNKINLNNLITESIPMTYLEGNYFTYLRKDTENDSYQVDYYPLGVCEVSDYTVGGEPYILINIQELESRLRKIYRKNKKNQFLFYKDADQEIKDTYPPEVYEAYKNKEPYAKLNIENTGLMRVNNLKRKYGLSPIFKSLKPVLRLENIELSDDKNTLVRGKKIIFQKLAKELITEAKVTPNITWSNAQAKAHVDLMAALNQKGVTVFTGLPWTESVSYIESKIEPTNVQVKRQYRDEITTSIGISYLSADKGSYGAAQISITELMKVINRIGEQLETILYKWYQGLLVDYGIDPSYAPKIRVMDSELLEKELRVSFATFLFDKMGASYQTTFEVLGRDYQTELMRRKQENEEEADKTFYPRVNAYTVSGNSDDNEDEVGRPSNNNDLNKKEYDSDYNKNQGR
ncbi:hypothetical protein CHH83_02615 [Bacillus sp. 7586-K]|nr:hypothetical protein CHH83_02615 [Bacillus sp. 7586-K]